MKLSVCLIVRDEEAVIARCLSCVQKFADEIIVVDTGSSDKTVDAATKFTDKIFYFKWCDDFSAARNFAFSKASGDFLMWIDADDVVDEENSAKIRELLKSDDFDLAYLKYAAAFDGDAPSFVYYRERIMRRSMNFRFTGAVHEAVAPRGRIIYSDACVFHKKVKISDPMRNLRIYQGLIASGQTLDGRGKFYYGRELFFNKMYRESVAVLEEFLQGEGWAENKIEACLNLASAYAALGDDEKSLSCLFRSFVYSPPRGQACCRIGEYFFERGENESAIFWYKTALARPDNAETGGFVYTQYSGFIPCIQLCVLYDRLGDKVKAKAYNELAGGYNPQSMAYLSNKAYFDELNEVKHE